MENLKVESFVERMLSAGYFPKELPTPFNTRSFGSWAGKNSTSLSNLPKTYQTKLVRHRLARPGTSRRLLGIPNPINQCRLVCLIKDSREILSQKVSLSPYAASQPVFHTHGKRALAPKYEHSLTKYKVKVRNGCRYILQADISRFYPSTYTHSIPWAIHGKSVSKGDKQSTDLVGNSIDKSIRDAQDGQTFGLPIGPDTSFLIAEILLASVDAELGDKFKFKGTRWYDDYEIGFFNKEDAGKFQVELEKELSKFELELSGTKTKILELPQQLEPSWISKMRELELPNHRERQADTLVSIFNLAFENSHGLAKDGAVKYAIRKLYNTIRSSEANRLSIHKYNWDLVQNLMFHSVLVEPNTLPTVVTLLSYVSIFGMKPDSEMLSEAQSGVVSHSVETGFTSDVAWAIWAFIDNQITIPEDLVNTSLRFEDDIVCLLLLDARDKGLVCGSPKWSEIDDFISPLAFKSDHWLLAYEATLRYWVSKSVQNNLLESQEAKMLLNAGISFYNSSPGTFGTARHTLGTPEWLLDLVPYR